MKILKVSLKVLIIVILILIILFVFLANFSSIESKYQCDGEITSQGEREAYTLYIKLEQYRFWVELWSDSDGHLWSELPKFGMEYYPRIEELGELFQIFDHSNGLQGHFSILSKILSLNTGAGFFDGKCQQIN